MQKTLFEQELQNGEQGVLSEKHIHLYYKQDKENKILRLRKVTYRDDERMYDFITDNFEINREEVPYIYKLR